MIPTVSKSRFRVLRYTALLFGQEFVRGNAAQKKRFLQRLTSPLLRKSGFYHLAYCLSSILHRASGYGHWLAAIAGLENRDVLASWIGDRTRPHIVVVSMGSVGDVLQITPLLHALKEKCPTADIAVLHRSPAVKTVLKNNPHVSTVAVADFQHFDALTRAVQAEGAADLVVEIRSMSFTVAYTCAPTALRHADFNKAFPESFFATAEAVRQRWQSPRGYQKPDGKFTWPEQWKDMTYLDVMGMMGNLPINAYSSLDFYSDAEAETVKALLATLPQNAPIITVQTGVDADVMNWATATGQRPTKLLPPQVWTEIVQQLTQKQFVVVQLGTESDTAIAGVTLDLRGKTSLSEAALLMKQAFCHLGTEGGLVHLARAVGLKSVVLFGPTSREFLGYPQNINLHASDCSGCWGATKDWYIYCPRGLAEPECMNSFRAEMVVQAVEKLKA